MPGRDLTTPMLRHRFAKACSADRTVFATLKGGYLFTVSVRALHHASRRRWESCPREKSEKAPHFLAYPYRRISDVLWNFGSLTLGIDLSE
jgi:hypothetical protein